MIGWLGFTLSLLSLPFLAWIEIRFFILKEDLSYYLYPILGIFAGLIISRTIFTNKTQIIFHEYRHMILSGLFGNKPKKLVVGNKTGSFEYEYSKDNAHANILISLAPYFLPFWTLIAFLIMFFSGFNQGYAGAILGIGIGMDIEQWWDGFHPDQSDFDDVPFGIVGSFLFCLSWQSVFLFTNLFLFIHGTKIIVDLVEFSSSQLDLF